MVHHSSVCLRATAEEPSLAFCLRFRHLVHLFPRPPRSFANDALCVFGTGATHARPALLRLPPAPEAAEGRADRGVLRQVSAQGLLSVPGGARFEGPNGMGEIFFLWILLGIFFDQVSGWCVFSTA